MTATLARTVLAALTMLVPASCTDPPHTTAPVAGDTRPPSPTVDPRVGNGAKDKVLAAYTGYREAYVAAAAAADFRTTGLKAHVGQPLLSQLLLALRQQDEQGIVYRGRPRWQPQVTDTKLTDAPYTVTVVDCLDTTGWDAVRRDTGQPAGVADQAKRYRVTSTATLFADAQWRITESVADRSQPC